MKFNQVLTTLAFLLSTNTFAAGLTSPNFESDAVDGLRAGEYGRDGHGCKAAAAQDGNEIIVQVFNANGKKCGDNSVTYTFKSVTGRRSIYRSLTLAPSGYTYFIRIIGTEAILLSISLEQLQQNKGSLYVRMDSTGG